MKQDLLDDRSLVITRRAKPFKVQTGIKCADCGEIIDWDIKGKKFIHECGLVEEVK